MRRCSTPPSAPLGGGCTLNVGPLLGSGIALPLAGALPGTGRIAFDATLPAVISPGTLTLQAAVQDATTALGFTMTNGVELVFP